MFLGQEMQRKSYSICFWKLLHSYGCLQSRYAFVLCCNTNLTRYMIALSYWLLFHNVQATHVSYILHCQLFAEFHVLYIWICYVYTTRLKLRHPIFENIFALKTAWVFSLLALHYLINQKKIRGWRQQAKTNSPFFLNDDQEHLTYLYQRYHETVLKSNLSRDAFDNSVSYIAWTSSLVSS